VLEVFASLRYVHTCAADGFFDRFPAKRGVVALAWNALVSHHLTNAVDF
jgi:hypothetical protein